MVIASKSVKCSRFSSLREGNLNRFYTRKEIGKLLTQQIGIAQQQGCPHRVIDLGAGDGSLSASVAECWKGMEIITVDIDPDCIQDLHANITEAGAARHQHHVQDVLDPNLTTALAVHDGFDLAVCNPPFFKPEWRRDFASILHHANFADACPSNADVSAEILFLAQNLRLVRKGGTIALIAPDGMITGWRTKPLRRALMSQHRIDCVLQLPPHSFHDTEARCFVLILTKLGGPTRAVKLLRYDAVSGLSKPLFVNADEGEQRLDYEYHAGKVAHGTHVSTLRQLGADIQRGSVSTVEAREATFPIFHTSDYSDMNSGCVELAPTMPVLGGKRLIVAQPGDILMARVDRRLHEKVVLVASGMAVLTDCVYRVRLPKNVQDSAFRALRSVEGTARLLAVSKGVSARLLGKADLLDMPLNM